MNANTNLVIEKFFPTMNVLFFALFMGQILYFFITLFLINSGSTAIIAGLDTLLMFITPVVVLSFVLAAKFIYSKRVAVFDRTLTLENKLISYRTNNIIKLALIEGANIFSITILFITANYFFAALFIIIISFFFLNKPTKDKFIMDYEISSEDALKILK